MGRKVGQKWPKKGDILSGCPQTESTGGIIQLTEQFEFPGKSIFANNSMIIDLRLRF